MWISFLWLFGFFFGFLVLQSEAFLEKYHLGWLFGSFLVFILYQ